MRRTVIYIIAIGLFIAFLGAINVGSGDPSGALIVAAGSVLALSGAAVGQSIDNNRRP